MEKMDLMTDEELDETNDFALFCKYLGGSIKDSEFLWKQLCLFNKAFKNKENKFWMPESNRDMLLCYIVMAINTGSKSILLADKEKTISSLNDKIDLLNQQIGSLTQQVKQLNNENASLSEKVTSLNAEKAKINRESILDNNKIKNLVNQNKQLVSQNNQLSNIAKELEAIVEKNSVKCYKEMSEANAQIEELRQECDSAKTKAEQFQKSCIEQYKYVIDDDRRKKAREVIDKKTENTTKRIILQIEKYLWDYYEKHNQTHLKRIPINDILVLCGCNKSTLYRIIKKFGADYESYIGDNHKCYEAWYSAGHKFSGTTYHKKVSV